MGSSSEKPFWARFSNTEAFAVLVSIAALLISAYAATLELKTHRDELGTEVIVDVYSEFRALTDLQVQSSEQSHLFEVRNYDAVKHEVALAASGATEAELAALRLKERAVAFSIFTGFERLFFLYHQAVETGDTARSVFLGEMLDYYTRQLFRNPRLRWLWSPSGGAIVQQPEPVTVEYYNRVMNGGKEDAAAEMMDSIGPFEKKTQT